VNDSFLENIEVAVLLQSIIMPEDPDNLIRFSPSEVGGDGLFLSDYDFVE
jgi:hypothetical protein